MKNQDPLTLTDKQIIERLATEVMGWPFDSFDHADEPGVVGIHVSIPDGGNILYWNPLTDWNHTMQIVEAMEAKGWKFSVVDSFGIVQFFRKIGEGADVSRYENRRKQICLAALDSLPLK